MKANTGLRFAVMVLVLAMLVAVIPVSQPAHAAGPWYVAPGGNDSNNCLSPTTACATINGALDKPGFVAGDAIRVAIGTYTGTDNEVVLLNKDATLSGGWDDTFATQNGISAIDGQQSRRGVTVNSGVAAIVERFAVQGGSGSNIYNDGHLTLSDCMVSRNTGPNTGSISNYGTLALNDSTVDSNESPGIENSGTMALTNSTISGNARSGIANYGLLTLDNSRVINNGFRGIHNNGTAVLNNSTVSGNRALGYLESGGGIYNWGGTVTLNNSTISGNTSTLSGGGIYMTGNGDLILNNCTVSDNAVDEYGGGIRVEEGTATLRNTLVAQNTADHNASDCLVDMGQIISAGYNLIGTTSGCIFTSGTGDLTDVNAHLGPLIGAVGAPGYHPLLLGSPAIDAGNLTGCTGSTGPLPADQRGVSRVGRCDIGAYEYTVPGPAASIYAFGGTPQHAAPLDEYVTPLQAAVLDTIGSPVNSATVVFFAPTNGASGTFADAGTYTTTATTSEDGIATAATFTANGLVGSYVVTATVGGVVTPANFLLTNIQWCVAPGGNDSNDCLSPTTPCATISGALGKPGFVAGDTVRVAVGTYTGTGDEVVLLSKSATLSGGWNISFTTQSGTSTIDGQVSRVGIRVNDGVTAVVERFLVQNGYLAGVWGGIINNGILTLNNSTVSGNADSGIYNGNTLTLNSSAVSGNEALGDGGGISSAYYSILTLNNSTVNANTARDGGGIYADGQVTLNNSTISGNTARDRGGGIRTWAGTVTLNNSTISGNAAGSGGGIWSVSFFAVILNNSIVAGNTAGSSPDCVGSISSLGYSLVGDTSFCGFTSGPGDLTNVNPKLGLLEDSPGYHPLLPSSPAINAGNPSGCTDNLGNSLNTDQRGAPRVGRCDIGAYEAGLFVTKQVYGTFRPGGLVTYTVALANLGGSIGLTNVVVTDTLPVSLTYVPGSYSATGGTGGESGGVIIWNGTVFSNTQTAIIFATAISDTTPRGVVITNTAAGNWRGVTVTGKAVFDTFLHVYLPIIIRNYGSTTLLSTP